MGFWHSLLSLKMSKGRDNIAVLLLDKEKLSGEVNQRMCERKRTKRKREGNMKKCNT